MSSTILVPPPAPPLYCQASSDADALDTIDAPHDERISSPKHHHASGHPKHDTLTRPVPEDEPMTSYNQNQNKSIPIRDMSDDSNGIVKPDENGIVGTAIKPSILFYDDNIDSVLTDSHESSGSFAARLDIKKKESPIKSNVATIEWHKEPDLDGSLNVHDDDCGIPISITIFRSTSVDPVHATNREVTEALTLTFDQEEGHMEASSELVLKDTVESSSCIQKEEAVISDCNHTAEDDPSDCQGSPGYTLTTDAVGNDFERPGEIQILSPEISDNIEKDIDEDDKDIDVNQPSGKRYCKSPVVGDLSSHTHFM